MADKFSVAAVQSAPVVLNLADSVDKACRLIGEAGRAGARLVVFPESFLPCYPFWVWFVPAGKTGLLRDLYTRLVQNSIDIAGDHVQQLCTAARRSKTNVVIGMNERNSEASGATLYNSLLFIDSTGTVVGCHRKLIPTVGERMVHGRGDGSTLHVYDFPGVGRVGGLICWENYMPLARYALYAEGLQIHVAPTWDRGEPWTSSLRHIAKEGRAYVIGCCSAIRRDQLADLAELLADYLPSTEWLNPGGSCIVDPDGKFLVEPVLNKEEIIYGECNPSHYLGPRYQLDVAGHYARPDVFDLRVNRRRQSILKDVSESFEAQDPEKPDPGSLDRAD